jgi:glyoxylase I family protein
MSQKPAAFLEHVAFRVKDLQWHIKFFEEVLGWKVRETDGDPKAPKQVWTFGALQLIADPAFDNKDGRFHHLGVMCEDAAASTELGLAYPGVTHLDRGRHWLLLPDGLVVELLQAKPKSAVNQALAVNARQ